MNEQIRLAASSWRSRSLGQSTRYSWEMAGREQIKECVPVEQRGHRAHSYHNCVVLNRSSQQLAEVKPWMRHQRSETAQEPCWFSWSSPADCSYYLLLFFLPWAFRLKGSQSVTGASIGSKLSRKYARCCRVCLCLIY